MAPLVSVVVVALYAHVNSFQCYYNTDELSGPAVSSSYPQHSQHDQKWTQDCCHAIVRATAAVGKTLLLSSSNNDDAADAGSGLKEKCVKNILNTKSLFPSTHDMRPNHLPHGIFNHVEEDRFATLLSEEHTQLTTSEEEKPPLWRFYLWNDSTQEGHWLADATQKIKDESSSSVVHYSLNSTLSSTGGLHRILRQRVTFTFPSFQVMEINADESATYHYDMYMLLQIPSGLFINLEDATSSMDSSINVQILGTIAGGAFIPNTTIDQEEPAFVSPPHALLLHVQGRRRFVEPTGSDELSWDTHLHVRYPAPLFDSNHHYVQITMMPPEVLYGHVILNEGEPQEQWWLLQPTYVVTEGDEIISFAYPDKQQPPIFLWVPAGHASDFPWVVIITLGAALFGTVVMLRDMAQLTKL